MGMSKITQHAAELHRQAVVIDTHSDILMAVADGLTRLGTPTLLPEPSSWSKPPRAITTPLGETAQPEFSPFTDFYGCAGQYSLPQWVQGGVTAQVCAIYLEDKQLDRALQRGLEMTWWLHHEVEENPALELITRAEQVASLKASCHTGVILALEGMEPLGPELRFLDLYYKLGLRIACLTHNRRNPYADGPQPGVTTGGLTVLGRQAVCRMDELGIVVDLAHTNQACFWEILEYTRKPVIVSHLSPFLFARWRGEPWPVTRFDPALDRQPLEAIANCGGVVGLIFFGHESLDHLVENFETLLELVGSDHIGLGSDFYGLESAPVGLKDISRLPRLTERLVQRGHSDETILKILGGNFLRLFKEVWRS